MASAFNDTIQDFYRVYQHVDTALGRLSTAAWMRIGHSDTDCEEAT